MNLKVLATGVIVLVVCVVGVVVVWARPPAPVSQPLSFNHKVHIAEDMQCTTCHSRVEKGPHATIPLTKGCLLCHSEAQGTHPDEPKVREYAERKEEIPWVRVNRLPGHVFFSHRAHVKFGGLDCKVCHGDMTQREAPVTRPQIGHLDMAACMGCHEDLGISNDCLRCHK